MVLEVTDEERDFLLELLEWRHKQMLHELHHTDTNDYKGFLRQRIELLERLTEKVSGERPVNAVD